MKAEKRFAWIEACLRFSGNFGAREKKAYAERFDLTAGVVSRDQDAFRHAFNSKCGYEAVKKSRGRLEPMDGVLPDHPIFKPPRAAQWLEEALGARFEIVPSIQRAEPKPIVLRAVVQALWARRCLSVDYQSRNHGKIIRLISPHTILYVAERLHLRAWDHSRSEARDFVLSRIVSASPPPDKAEYVGIEHDREWFEHVILEIMPAEGETIDALQPDYGLDNQGRTSRRVRKAHEFYLCSANADTADFKHSPILVRRRNAAS